jgi:hypothetical protein
MIWTADYHIDIEGTMTASWPVQHMVSCCDSTFSHLQAFLLV